jgi:hypothetical protein
MKIIESKRKPLSLEEYRLRSASEEDYHTLHTESVIVKDADTGLVKAIYKELDLDPAAIVEALKKIDYQTSERSGGLKTTSRIFGYAPRMERRNDFCHVASLALDYPNEHKIICDYAKQVSDVYAQTNPELYKQHVSEAGKVLHDYVIEDTPFTSGIVNKNNPLKYHFDTGNFTDVYSCMLGFKHGIGGGYLAMPEYDCAFEIRNNSIFIFDGQMLLHGVTPIRYLTEDAYRFTVVYYSLKKMWECLTIDEEISRVRQKRTEKEQRRATMPPEYYVQKYKKKESKKFENIR